MTAADPRLPDLDTWREEARECVEVFGEHLQAGLQARRFLAVTAAYNELREVLNAWGVPLDEDAEASLIADSADFAEAIQESGAWRFARDIRRALLGESS